MKFRQRAKEHLIKIGQQQVKMINFHSPKLTVKAGAFFGCIYETKMSDNVYFHCHGSADCCSILVYSEGSSSSSNPSRFTSKLEELLRECFEETSDF